MLKRSILSTVLFSQLMTSGLPVLASGGPSRPIDSEERAVASGSQGISSTSLATSAAQSLDWDAINPLWNARDEQRAPNRENLRPLLLEVAQTPRHPDQGLSCLRLWHSKGESQEEDRALLRPMLLEMAQNPALPFHWEALRSLWNAEQSQQQEDPDFALSNSLARRSKSSVSASIVCSYGIIPSSRGARRGNP